MALPYLFPQDASLFEGRGEVMALVAAALLVMAVAMRSEEGNLPVLVGLVSGVFMHGVDRACVVAVCCLFTPQP